MICELALVLMLDASGSIRDPEWRLQVEGHVEALMGEEVRGRMVRDGPTAVMAMAFSERQTRLVDWTVVRTEEEVRGFAAELQRVRRPRAGGTSTGAALGWVAEELRSSVPCAADREVIDLVTDGRPDDGWLAGRIRETLMERGTVVNVLVVDGTGDNEGEWAQEMVTPGGFVLEVESWAEFGRAIRRKLSYEVGMR